MFFLVSWLINIYKHSTASCFLISASAQANRKAEGGGAWVKESPWASPWGMETGLGGSGGAGIVWEEGQQTENKQHIPAVT